MEKILILNFVVMAVFNFAHPVTPDMLILKNAPEYLNGILYALMSLSMFLFSPFWGNKTDKFGPKKYLVLGPLGYGIMQLVFGFGQNALIMGIGRFIAGIFSACFIVALMQYVNLISTPEKKVKNFGLIMVTNGIGGVVGQLIAGYIGIKGGIFILIPFILQFILCTIIGIIVYFTIPVVKKEVKNNRHESISFKTSYQLIKKNHLLPILTTVLTLAIATNLYTSHIGYFVTEVYNFNSFMVSLVNSYTNAIVMLTNLLLIGYIKTKFGTLKGIKYEFIVALISFSTIFYLPIKFAIIFIGFFIAATAIYRPLVQEYVVTKDEAHSGELMGIINSVNSLGMIIGSLSSGFLFTFGKMLPFYVLIIVLIMGLIVFLIKVESKNSIN